MAPLHIQISYKVSVGSNEGNYHSNNKQRSKVATVLAEIMTVKRFSFLHMRWGILISTVFFKIKAYI